MPELVGGSADLAPSTLTLIDGGGDVERGSYGGRNLHFGIREHAMGAIVNGLCLSGLRGYGATFLIFSDYMKGAVRLAALMELPSIFVYTHDSIGLGEDGPTHQPIEQLAALRATPNINVVRPADAHETALAWRFALRSTETPTVLALSRQSLPVLDPDLVPDDAIERGAYVLARRRRRRARPGPDRHRLRGLAVRRRRRHARRGRRRRARRQHAVHGSLRGAQRGRARSRAGTARHAARSRSRPRARSAGTAGSASAATSSACTRSARPAPRPTSTRTSASPRRPSSSGPAHS